MLLTSCLAHATLYQQQDSHGNRYFSDRPSAAAQIVVLQPINSYSTTPDNTATQNQPSTPAAKYTQLSITSPLNQQTFDNTRTIPVTVTLAPTLASGDAIELWLDDQLYQRSTEPQFSLHNLDRGAHRLQAKLVDNKHQALISSAVVQVFVHYARQGTEDKKA